MCIVLATDKGVYQSFRPFFKDVEIFVVVIFSIEYVLRLIAVKKLKDIFSPMLLFDFIAIFPYYLSFFTINITFLRAIRLIKIFQILKVTRYSRAMQSFFHVFKNKKEELLIVFFLLAISIVISASLMYLAEGKIQSNFSSIPKAMWWAIVTFTGVGYGDTYPITGIGKIIASFVAILGVGLHGILIAILGAGFIEQIPAIAKKRIKSVATAKTY